MEQYLLTHYVFTHDSVAVGEDGPTDEPVEALAPLRAMPGLSDSFVLRMERVAAAWSMADSSRNNPTVLVMISVKLTGTAKTGTAWHMMGLKRCSMWYRQHRTKKQTQLSLASGSLPRKLAVAAEEKSKSEGIDVSAFRCLHGDLLKNKTRNTNKSVLPKDVKKRLGIEMGASLGWHKYVGDEGDILAIDTFGASAPGNVVLEKYGFTTDNVVSRVKNLLK